MSCVVMEERQNFLCRLARFTGVVILGALKMQDWKMTDESAGLENAGLENNGLEFAELEI